MSIKADIQELESIQIELKNLALRRKELKETESAVKARITEYLKAKDQIGLKHQGKAILLEEKETRERKKKKQSEEDSIALLRNYGVENPEKVLLELKEAQKGDPVVKENLKMKKYKET